jgi:esterase
MRGTPCAFRPQAEQIALSLVMPNTSGFVHNASLPLRYVEWAPEGPAGERLPTIVLLHGLRAYAHWFDELADAARSDFRLIALDQRGRGGSGWSPEGVYNTDAYVADLEHLVDQLGLQRFSLVGHSMGGTNSVNYAARHPDRVKALVIVDSAPELDMRGVTRIREEMARTPADFASREDAYSFLRGLHRRASEANFATRLEWMLKPEPDGRLSWRIDPAIFTRMTPDPPQRAWTALANIPCPTLIVRAAESDLVTPDVVSRMLVALPQGSAVEVADAGHMVLEDNPAGFNAAVIPFLKQAMAN